MITFNRLEHMGRLGNQLFQIAATIGAATRHRQAYVLPQWSHNHWLESPMPIGQIRDYSEYKESKFTYEPITLDNRNWTLSGYFQSEKYFKPCEELIRSRFKLKKIASDVVLNIGADNKTASIHVRRGDYLQRTQYHPVQPSSYYIKALELLKSKTQINRVIVVSDDIQWCKSHLGIQADFMSGNPDIIDMFIIASCGHHIIANSSFSWWGAWLSQTPGKLIIAPDNWFGPASPHSTHDLFPPNWIKL